MCSFNSQAQIGDVKPYSATAEFSLKTGQT